MYFGDNEKVMINNNNLVSGFNDEKDDSLKISLERIDTVKGGLCIYLNGYIDTYNSNFFQKKIQKIVDSGYINLIFNCSKTAHPLQAAFSRKFSRVPCVRNASERRVQGVSAVRNANPFSQSTERERFRSDKRTEPVSSAGFFVCG